jgi:hypothetical protein
VVSEADEVRLATLVGRPEARQMSTVLVPNEVAEFDAWSGRGMGRLQIDQSSQEAG